MFKDSDLPVSIANGAFRLTKTLGKGGMAIVYAAVADLDKFDYALVICHHEAQRGETRAMREQRRDERYEQWVRKPREELVSLCRQHRLPFPDQGKAAVKIMMPHLEQTERFRAEWESLLAIGHPNLVQVYGGGHDEERDLHYYAMELLDGILSNKRVSELALVDKLSIVRQAAQGLDCLHGRGIVHRDIKPGNIVCTQSPLGLSAKVADLGIAKDTNRTQQLTITDQVMGTPYYMAPEQAEGAKLATHLSDVYSLGATLYFLICGQAPYQGQSLYEVMGKLARGAGPEPIRKLSGGNTPAALEILVERMMALEPADRPVGMSHVVQAIDRILELEGEQMGDARTIVELKPRGRAAREARTQIEALLGGPPPSRAKKGGGGAKLALVAVVLLAFAGGFAAGPGRHYIVQWLGRKGAGSGSEGVASGSGSARGSTGTGSGSTGPLAVGSGSGSVGSGSELAVGSGSGSVGSGSELAVGSGSGSVGSGSELAVGSGSMAVVDPLAARKVAFEEAMMDLHDRVKALVAADDFDGALALFPPLLGEAIVLGQRAVLDGARERVENDRVLRVTAVEADFVAGLGGDLDAAAKALALLARLDSDPARTAARGARLEAQKRAAMGAGDLAKRKAEVEQELARAEELAKKDQLALARAALAGLADAAKAVGLADAHGLASVRIARQIATRADALVSQAREALATDPAAAGAYLAKLRELAPQHPGLAPLVAAHAAALEFLVALQRAEVQAREMCAADRHVDAGSILGALGAAADQAGARAPLDAAIASVLAARRTREAELAKDFAAAVAKDPVVAYAALERLERFAPDHADLPVLWTRLFERLLADSKKTLADLTINASKHDRYSEAIRMLERMGELARAGKNADLSGPCEVKLKTLVQTRDVLMEEQCVQIDEALAAKNLIAAKKALAELRVVYPGHPGLAAWREKIEQAVFVPLALAQRTPAELGVRALGGKVALKNGAIDVEAAITPVELELRVPKLGVGRWALTIEIVGRVPGAIEVAGQGWRNHAWVPGDGVPGQLPLRRWTHLGGPAAVWVTVPPGCSLVVRSAELRKVE